MFGISGEHILILGIVLLIFGPRRLPELGNTLGKAIRNFKDSVAGVEDAKFRRIEEQVQSPPQRLESTVQPAAASAVIPPQANEKPNNTASNSSA